MTRPPSWQDHSSRSGQAPRRHSARSPRHAASPSADRAADRRDHQRTARARRAAADRAGDDRRRRREPHRGARGGRRAARRGAGRHPPGRRRLRGRRAAPAVPHRDRRSAFAARGASRSWSCAPGSRSKPPASPPSAPRRPHAARHRERATRRSSGDRARRSRHRPGFRLPPQHRRRRPAIRNSCAFSNISAASSFRARRSASPTRPAERRAYLRTIQNEHRESSTRSAPSRCAAARAAMQRHLLNSRKRYQRPRRSSERT